MVGKLLLYNLSSEMMISTCTMLCLCTFSTSNSESGAHQAFRDGWMNGWMDEWLDGWMDGWMTEVPLEH